MWAFSVNFPLILTVLRPDHSPALSRRAHGVTDSLIADMNNDKDMMPHICVQQKLFEFINYDLILRHVISVSFTRIAIAVKAYKCIIAH